MRGEEHYSNGHRLFSLLFVITILMLQYFKKCRELLLRTRGQGLQPASNQ